MKESDLGAKKQKSSRGRKVRIPFLLNEPAREMLHPVGTSEGNFLLGVVCPEMLGFQHDVTIGEFYAEMLKRNYQLCPMSDIYAVIQNGREIGNNLVHLGMIPFMCADKQKRILTFRQDAQGMSLIDGVRCQEYIWMEHRFIFRIPSSLLNREVLHKSF